ncbi:hypothetical protein A8B78_12130 [Jannaschia sp. EhC01]|nr:hypothetical protein A8B78_12130 [Jannaschia sp. EhC01]
MHAVIKQILHNRYLHLLVGVLIIVSASTEMVEDFRAWEENDGLQPYHGVALVGVWHVIKALAEIYESIVVIEEDQSQAGPRT